MCASEKPDFKEMKKQLCHLFIEVNKEIYGYGVMEIKVLMVENMLLFLTKDNRVHILKLLEQRSPELKCAVDRVLFDEFKRKLQISLERNLNLSAEAIFRDFDSVSGMSITAAVFDREASKLFR